MAKKYVKAGLESNLDLYSYQNICLAANRLLVCISSAETVHRWKKLDC